GNFTITINWEDGTTSGGTLRQTGAGQFAVVGTHVFGDEGLFHVSVQVDDTDGTSASTQTTATVDESLLPGGTRGTANERFVSEVYHDLLGRAVEPQGLAVWSGALDAGIARPLVVFTIESSPEYRTVETQALYHRFFQRAADPQGLAGSAAFLEGGGTVEQLAVILVTSPEYAALHGISTNDGFLDALYADTFRRAVDPVGRNGWDTAFAHGARRDDVAAQV